MSSTSPMPSGSQDPSRPSLRVGHAEREAAIEQLTQAYADGQLDATEFEDRAESAMRARTRGELEPLTADLGPAPDPAVEKSAPSPAGADRRRRAVDHMRAALLRLCCCAPPRDPVDSPHRGVDVRR